MQWPKLAHQSRPHSAAGGSGKEKKAAISNIPFQRGPCRSAVFIAYALVHLHFDHDARARLSRSCDSQSPAATLAHTRTTRSTVMHGGRDENAFRAASARIKNAFSKIGKRSAAQAAKKKKRQQEEATDKKMQIMQFCAWIVYRQSSARRGSGHLLDIVLSRRRVRAAKNCTSNAFLIIPWAASRMQLTLSAKKCATSGERKSASETKRTFLPSLNIKSNLLRAVFRVARMPALRCSVRNGKMCIFPRQNGNCE